MSVVRRGLGEHALGEAVGGRDDLGVARPAAAKADVLAGRRSAHALGGEALAEPGLAGALVLQPQPSTFLRAARRLSPGLATQETDWARACFDGMRSVLAIHSALPCGDRS